MLTCASEVIEHPDIEKKNYLVSSMESILFDIDGPMMTGDRMWMALGYSSVAAFHQSLIRDTVPVPLIVFPHRRAQRFSLVYDVAAWLIDQRFSHMDIPLHVESGSIEAIPCEVRKKCIEDFGPLLKESSLPSFMSLLGNWDEKRINLPFFKISGRREERFILTDEILSIACCQDRRSPDFNQRFPV